MTPIFETARLLAREFDVGDAEAAFEIYGDPMVMEFIGPNRVSTDIPQQREALATIRAKYAAYGEPFGAFALIEKDGVRLVGTGILRPLPDGNGVDTEDIEVGWHLARRVWGRGLATEVGRALTARAFERLSISVLNVVIHPGNVRSVAVAERLGATHVGRTVRYYGVELEHFQLPRPVSGLPSII